jgi:hypothetical protein
MAFQLDQLSVPGLRRLVKDLRSSLAAEGIDLTQHRAQEVLAHTLGHASWHAAHQAAQARPSHSRSTAAHDQVTALDPDWVNTALRQASQNGQDTVPAAVSQHWQQLVPVLYDPSQEARALLHLGLFRQQLDDLSIQLAFRFLPSTTNLATQQEFANAWKKSVLTAAVNAWLPDRVAYREPFHPVVQLVRGVFHELFQAPSDDHSDRLMPLDWLTQPLTLRFPSVGRLAKTEQQELTKLWIGWGSQVLTCDVPEATKVALVTSFQRDRDELYRPWADQALAEARQAWLPQLWSHQGRASETSAKAVLPLFEPADTLEVLQRWTAAGGQALDGALRLALARYEQRDEDTVAPADRPPVFVLQTLPSPSPHVQALAERRREHFSPFSTLTPLIQWAGTERISDFNKALSAYHSSLARADAALRRDTLLTEEDTTTLMAERQMVRRLERMAVMACGLSSGTDAMRVHLIEQLTLETEARFWWSVAAAAPNSDGRRTMQALLRDHYPSVVGVGHPKGPHVSRARRRQP